MKIIFKSDSRNCRFHSDEGEVKVGIHSLPLRNRAHGNTELHDAGRLWFATLENVDPKPGQHAPKAISSYYETREELVHTLNEAGLDVDIDFYAQDSWDYRLLKAFLNAAGVQEKK